MAISQQEDPEKLPPELKFNWNLPTLVDMKREFNKVMKRALQEVSTENLQEAYPDEVIVHSRYTENDRKNDRAKRALLFRSSERAKATKSKALERWDEVRRRQDKYKPYVNKGTKQEPADVDEVCNNLFDHNLLVLLLFVMCVCCLSLILSGVLCNINLLRMVADFRDHLGTQMMHSQVDQTQHAQPRQVANIIDNRKRSATFF